MAKKLIVSVAFVGGHQDRAGWSTDDPDWAAVKLPEVDRWDLIHIPTGLSAYTPRKTKKALADVLPSVLDAFDRKGNKWN